MSVIIRLQNLPLTASSLDIRNFFHGLSIPDGGVHIVGGPEGDAFIAFSTDEDARQAMRLSGSHLKESRVSLLLSSRNEMYKVIEQARIAALSGGGGGGGPPPSSHHQTSLSSNNSTSHHYNSHHHHLGGDSSSSPPQTHLSSQVSSSTSLLGAAGRLQSGNNSVSSSMSPTSSGPTANDYLRSLAGGSSGAQADLSSNPALLFSTMSAIPSATLGASPNAYLNQQHGHQGFASLASATGSPSTASQQQNQAYPGGNVANTLPNLSAPPPTSVFPNGNPFLIPPPNLSNLTLPFQGLMQGGNDSTSTNNAAANLGGAGVGHGSPGTLGLGMPPASTGVLGLPPNFLSSMSMAGQHGANPLNNLNPFGNNSPTPSRMGLLNNNANNNGNLGGSPNPGRIAALSAMGFGGNGPRFGNNDIGSMNSHGNAFGAGVGATGGGHRPQNFQNRFPFGNHAGQQDNSNRFQLGAIPSGRAGVDAMNNRDNNRRGFSPNRDRRPGPGGPGGALAADNMANRRRRSRSRERDRGAGRGEDRRRRRSRSRSKSRSRSRDRSLGAGKPTRRDSRDKRDHERRSRSDSSPEKNSQDSHGSRSRRDHEPSPTPNSSNTTTDEWPGAKLTGIPNDASYREIKEFIRVDVMGGSDGVVRLYDEGVAFLKLENPTEFPRVYRSNGRKLRGSNISIEGITMETWTNEYKLNKSRLERDIDREREEREKDRENFRRDSDRGKDHGRDRDNRHPHHHGGNSSNPTSHSNQRSSRFSNATHQSSCIAIRGLAPTVTTQEIVLRYLRETPYQDIVLIAAPTPTNRHSVTAFIQFESPQIAQGVIDGIVRSPLSNTLVVESCELEHLQNAKAKTNGAGNGFGKGGLSSMNSVSGVTDAKSIFDLDLGLDDETTTIIIKGAPPNVSERDVFDFFSDIGLTPMNVRILYGNDGQCTGQVICEFADNNKAKRATTKDGMLFGRGQVSVSLLPSRNTNKPKAAEDFNSGLQPGFLQRGHGQRPGLLGPAPGGGRGGQAGGSRFSNPTGNSFNIFEQALQQQQTPMSRHGGEGGGRGRGGANSRGRGERMSRFSNNDRTDFRNHNNGMGRGGGRGGGNSNTNHNNSSSSSSTAGDLIITDDEMALFNKKGCVIGLENIPYKSSMDDILQYLEDSLKIRIAPDRIIRRYDDNQKPTGDARVAFDTEFEAKLACDRLRGTYMWKRLISATIIE